MKFNLVPHLNHPDRTKIHSSIFVGSGLAECLWYHCFSYFKEPYYHCSLPGGQKKYILVFKNTAQMMHFQPVGPLHPDLGSSRYPAAPDAIIEIENMHFNLHTGVFVPGTWNVINLSL